MPSRLETGKEPPLDLAALLLILRARRQRRRRANTVNKARLTVTPIKLRA